MADPGRELRDILELARKRPILIVGAGLVILLLAAILNRQGDATDELPADDAELAGDGGTGELGAADGGTLTFGSEYTLPTYGGTGGSGSYDPFTGDSSDYTPPATTPPATTPPATTPPATTPPASSGVKGARIVIERGAEYNTYTLQGNRLRGTHRRQGSRVTWRTSSPALRKRTMGGSTISVVQLKSGPYAGRWIAAGGKGKRWYPA